jgi:hypothetical protein
MKYTIVISKPKNVRTTYVNHGIRNNVGGFGGTADAGWSFKQAIRFELSRLPLDATEYDIEINGKITASGMVNT